MARAPQIATRGSGDAAGDTLAAQSDPAQRLPIAGERIGQYEIIRELGRGGMGAVYLARDIKLGRRAAIKFLQSDQPELTERFIREARATARCNHENIVVIYEAGEHAGGPFMVLEYLHGAPLSSTIRAGYPLPQSRAIELIVPVVRALVCAHQHKIVHRDLKPDNIFVTDTGTVKVLDFGIAKLVQEALPSALPSVHQSVRSNASPGLPASASSPALGGGDEHMGEPAIGPELTRHGAIVGTVPYMSPEQWLGVGVDHQTDIWATGILLYQMLAGRHPLAPLVGRQLMVTGILDQPMPSLREACPELPDELIRVVDRCLVKPKAERMASAEALLDALEPLLPGRYTHKLRLHENPYPGLSAFQESDANRFFGRAQEVTAAVARLRDQPLLGVVGPSGVGKSSFVRAGVVPALKHSGTHWSALVVRPGRHPMSALASLLTPLVATTANTAAHTRATPRATTEAEDDLSGHDAMLDRLSAEPGYLGVLLRSRARRTGHNILLFIDQFEELYTLVDDPKQRSAFTACLASVADDATTPLRVMLSIRSDFLDRVSEDPRFMAELSRSLFFLAPPSRASLREAIVAPAEMAGYRFEVPAVVDHMLDHLEHTPGALPLLQFAASKLWDLRDKPRQRLTEAGYAALGGIAGALASHADTVVAELPPNRQALARAMFLRLVTPERTRAVVPVDELAELAPNAGEVRQLVDHLVHARLLVVQGGDVDGGAAVEIVHESLIMSWPLLRRWLDENQDDAAFLDQLRTAAKQWQAKDYRDGLLWRGEAMEEAKRWHRRYTGQLPELQDAYLRAVFALAARGARRRSYALLGALIFLTMLVAAGAVALVLIRDAQQEAVREAQAANRARDEVRDKLAQVEAAKREREQAQASERTARIAAERASERAAQAATALEKQNQALGDALARAEAATRETRQALGQAEAATERARQARTQAEENAAIALAAEEAATRANRRLKELRERDQERIERLQKASGTIIERLDPGDLSEAE